MAPVRPRKRESSTPTTTPQRGPIKRRKIALTLAQKQALIDNLQLEITERARRLRAQYNVQAQQLRSRVEMRVNRIPTSLRKAKMGELLAKHSEPHPSRAARSPYVTRPPPVPAKDGTSPKPIPRKPISTNESLARRPHQGLSGEMARVDDKENSAEPMGNPKKRVRPGAAMADALSMQPSHVLSPTSTNARVVPRAAERPTSPVKTTMVRPPSPTKSIASKASSNILSSTAEKGKGSRAAAASRKAAIPAASGGAAATATRSRKPPLPAAATTASTRGRRKVSGTSESSESSTATVVKKTTTSKATAAKPPPAAKRTIMSTIKSATTKRAPASKATAAPASTTGTGRTLRKRAGAV